MGATQETMTTTATLLLPPLLLTALEESSYLVLTILFRFGGQEAVAAVAGYTELAFSVFDWGYLLILHNFVHW